MKQEIDAHAPSETIARSLVVVISIFGISNLKLKCSEIDSFAGLLLFVAWLERVNIAVAFCIPDCSHYISFVILVVC